MPDLAVDQELSDYLAEHGHPRKAATIRQWRDAGLLTARSAPGLGTGKGRRASRADGDDRSVCLLLAKAFDADPKMRPTLAEAAITAWGDGAPIADFGLRQAFDTFLAATTRSADTTMSRLKSRTRKALDALRATGHPGAAEVALRAALGDEPTCPEDPIALASGVGMLPALAEEKLTLARLGSRPQAKPALLKLFEGPLQLATFRRLAEQASRTNLDRARHRAGILLASNHKELVEFEADMAHGLRIALLALVLVSLDKTLQGRAR